MVCAAERRCHPQEDRTGGRSAIAVQVIQSWCYPDAGCRPCGDRTLVVVRSVLPLSLRFDHCVVTGKELPRSCWGSGVTWRRADEKSSSPPLRRAPAMTKAPQNAAAVSMVAGPNLLQARSGGILHSAKIGVRPSAQGETNGFAAIDDARRR